jgi:NADH dehydrogenase
MILVIGGTGLVGGETLRLLSQAGISATALSRNPEKAPDMTGDTWVSGDLAKPDTLSVAFGGSDAVFLITSIGR